MTTTTTPEEKLDDVTNEEMHMELKAYTDLVDQLLTSLANDEDDDEEVGRHTTATTIIKLEVSCKDVDDTFTVRDIKMIQNPDDKCLEITVYYTVCHLTKDDELKATIQVQDTTDRVDAIFELFWNYKLCPECLLLIKKDKEVCEDCMFHKMRQQYGLKKAYITELPSCSICQEKVYHTRLQCGHYIHHTCLLKLNPFKYFRRCEDIKCPVCRRALTHSDKNRFFVL